jgi:hypothetical protein
MPGTYLGSTALLRRLPSIILAGFVYPLQSALDLEPEITLGEAGH